MERGDISENPAPFCLILLVLVRFSNSGEARFRLRFCSRLSKRSRLLLGVVVLPSVCQRFERSLRRGIVESSLAGMHLRDLLVHGRAVPLQGAVKVCPHRSKTL